MVLKVTTETTISTPTTSTTATATTVTTTTIQVSCDHRSSEYNLSNCI